MRAASCWSTAAVLAAVPALAHAHSFGRVLTLPVPLWLYLYGSAAALLLSFAVLGMQRGAAAGVGPHGSATWPRAASSHAERFWQARGVAALARAAATAFAGTLNPYRNFSMTWFWVVFLLGGLYASALWGERAAWLNPWRTLLLAIEHRRPRRDAAWAVTPPRAPDCTPALALYVALIAFELFGHGSPRSLGIALTAYTLVVLAGGLAFGGATWLARGELFDAYFGIAARLAPTRAGTVARLSREDLPGVSALLFVLFMLASTAFDGLKETVLWNTLWWQGLAPTLTPLAGGNLAKAYPLLARWQDALNFGVLLLSPALYLAVCALALLACRALMPAAARAPWSLRSLLLALGPSLIPIAVAYNASHYANLLVAQGSRVVALLLDPFGSAPQATLFGLPAPSPLVTWHVQVAIILAGHVLGMAICHRRLALHGVSRGRNALVQLPLLLLMVALTASGLWVMSLPVNPSRAL